MNEPKARAGATIHRMLIAAILLFGVTGLASAELHLEVDLDARPLTAYDGADVVPIRVTG